jgi:LCP family protein required for cell wall assembly
MRGIYVSIPDDPDPAYRPYWSSRYMLNAAHTWGGPRLLMKTIQRNFRVHVTQYVATDFSGFKDAIDTVGGVTIHLSEKEAKHLRGKGFGALTAGDNLLDGEAALAYARIRKIDSDFRRMERQRKVMLSLFDKMTKSNPAKLTESAKALMPCITTNMTDGEILGEIVNFYQYRTYSVDQLFLPLETYDAKVTIRGMEMYDIDWEKNIRALHEFMRK